MFLPSIPSKQVLAVRRIEFEHITAALILKTDANSLGHKEFVYSHIDGCEAAAVAVQDSGMSV
jgi:hypothetical protein